MKHLFLVCSVSFCLLAVSLNLSAQKKVTIHGGTIVTVAAVENLKAADCSEGDRVNFKLVRDVKVDGNVVIPAGTMAFGKVTEAKRSSCFGTKG